MTNRSKPKKFGEMLVAKLDKRLKVGGKWVSQRELIIRAAVEGAQKGIPYFQKLLLEVIETIPPSNFSGANKEVLAEMRKRLAIAKAGRGSE